ncbi:dihydrofolate reductase family protein [Streptomyces sp. HUAS TT11]|uniref:dihydrofolate reductase family protein n=1 Tax=Streptomyces sp. HUAS TT11 TaxID=3447508 RepID=UPI003F65FDC5
MGRLVVTAFITLDGVSRAPGGPREDREGGFEQGGRSVPYGDGDFGAFLAEVLDRSGAFLLGRRTYDISAAHRPRVTDPADPVASRLTSLSKYVVSRTLAVPSRAGTTVLGGDLAEEVTAVGERTEGELQVHGSGALVRSLLALDPVDPCTRWCSRSCPAPGAASSPRVPLPRRGCRPRRVPPHRCAHHGRGCRHPHLRARGPSAIRVVRASAERTGRDRPHPYGDRSARAAVRAALWRPVGEGAAGHRSARRRRDAEGATGVGAHPVGAREPGPRSPHRAGLAPSGNTGRTPRRDRG